MIFRASLMDFSNGHDHQVVKNSFGRHRHIRNFRYCIFITGKTPLYCYPM